MYGHIFRSEKSYLKHKIKTKLLKQMHIHSMENDLDLFHKIKILNVSILIHDIYCLLIVFLGLFMVEKINGKSEKFLLH